MPKGENSPFKKGHEKIGGRTKGTPNKKTEQWDMFASFCLEEGLEKFRKELSTLKGEKYVNAYISLLEFHKPKLARTQTEIELPDNTVKVVKTIINGAS